MSGRTTPAVRTGPAAAALLLAGLASWAAVARGASNLDATGPAAFAGAWTLMMAAMMLPSSTRAGRAVAEVSARTDARWAGPAPAAFAIGYLAVWLMVGLAGAGVLATGRAVGVHPGGRAVAAGVLLAAALYELTPVKDACLRGCRHPVGLVVTHWRPGPLGAVRIGALYGRWCVGCCWALMAGLLVLGAMSMGWMLLVAALIAAEKLVPWERVATWGVAATLLGLAVAQLAV